MAKPALRITIPTNPDDLIDLASAILSKHETDGAASPLNSLPNVPQIITQLSNADDRNKASKELYRQAEKATQDRDLCLGISGTLTPVTIRHFVTAARDLLTGIHKGNEQTLGGWGFEVATSPKAPKSPRDTTKTTKAA